MNSVRLTKTPYCLLIIGFDEIVSNKYWTEIQDARQQGLISRVDIVDLETNRKDVFSRMSILGEPGAQIHFLAGESTVELQESFSQLHEDKFEALCPLRVYIATEVRWHEWYLEFFLQRGEDVLVEKPVFAPTVDGVFDPSRLVSGFDRLNEIARRTGATCSVMTLSRYHDVYTTELVDRIRQFSSELRTPLTSLHVRHAGGVWTRPFEFLNPNDHPYRFGYGMMMHGAYHYIDLASEVLRAGLLENNHGLLTFEATGFAATPDDYQCRVPKHIDQRLGPLSEYTDLPDDAGPSFGETDVVAAIRVRDARNGASVLVGSMSFEQSTTSMRSWPDLNGEWYNRKGRCSLVSLDATFSALYSVHVVVYDVPIHGSTSSEVPSVERVDARALIRQHLNAAVLGRTEYFKEDQFEGLFHSNSNRALMRAWLRDSETKSTLSSHRTTHVMMEALLLAFRCGSTVAVNL
ncbi:MAG: Gfo/Idh/MocA family oxidoreductase [Xanthomonadales bacterium]|nr:Gfo/Idh/MocA family oxidoreductase [Xanthomonadales bacterium]